MRIVPAFLRAKRLLSQGEIDLVERVLYEWQKEGIGRTVSANLRDREYFLPRRNMAELLRALIRLGGEPLERVAKEYEQECYRHQLRGGRVRLFPLPEHLGRAVDSEKFALYLHNRYQEDFPKFKHAREFVAKLTLALREIDDQYQELEMSQYTAWATWTEGDPTADPFSFVTYYLAAEVQAALGLDPRIEGRLLLLRFRRPDDLPLYRPTVADAGLFPYFDPPMSSEKAHSRTRPWPHFLIRESPPEYGSADSHPEAVHGPVTLRTLTQNVEALP